MSVKIGVGLFTGQLPSGSSRTFATEYRETLELVRLAEDLGFDSAWVSEHHGSSDGYLPSLLPMLAAFAAVTERIELATGLMLTPFHDPLRLAEDAAVVDQISGGRLIVGLGLGWRAEEFRMFGVPMRERAARTVETIEVLRRAWSRSRFSFQGEIFRYDRVKVTPPPARPGGIPIHLGGHAERAVRRAGQLADGFIYIPDTGADDEVRPALEHLAAGAHEAGRDPDEIAFVWLQNAFVSAEPDALAAARSGIAHQIGAYQAWDDGQDTPEHDSLEPPPPTDAELRSSTIAGSPDEVSSALGKILAPAADLRDVHLVVRLHYPGMDLATATNALEMFGREVLPALRSG
jgi:probable F420-dependent oxidoreductase